MQGITEEQQTQLQSLSDRQETVLQRLQALQQQLGQLRLQQQATKKTDNKSCISAGIELTGLPTLQVT